MFIPFNRPVVLEDQVRIFEEVLKNKKFSGDNAYTQHCHRWFNEYSNGRKTLLTTSCTHALEMCAMLLNIQPGDEVIMPSYNFVSAANAFVLRGAKVCFVDVRPDTLNIDETLIESAITERTKAIVVVHYAGIGCEMDAIMSVATKHQIPVVEDAAQGIQSFYNSKPLGTIGTMGTLSFHETKNCHCGEGGALIINDETLIEKAEIIREKGTNRSAFFRGEVDKYSWIDLGSSYLPSELNASYLYPQLLKVQDITDNRLETWNYYHRSLQSLQTSGQLELPTIPENCGHNGHIFWLKVKDLAERTALLSFLRSKEIQAVFHYVPLHSAAGGQKYSEFVGQDIYTTKESERLLRLPLYYDMQVAERAAVVDAVKEFFAA